MDSDSQNSSDNDNILIESLTDYEDYTDGENDFQLLLANIIDDLRKQLIIMYGIQVPIIHANPRERQAVIKLKIEDIFDKLLQQIMEGKELVLRIRNPHSWRNCIFGNTICLKTMENCTLREIKFCNKKSLPKFSTIYYILGKIYKLVSTGEICTKRELFYQNVESLSEQHTLDSVLNDITCLLDCPLYDLNIYSTSKGLIFGPLTILTEANEIYCGNNHEGILVPNDVNNIINLKSNAKFVLLIEKDAVFQKLLDNKINKKLPPCIFVTGKGMPDVNTRAMLRAIWQILQIPILALVDADPWGIDIMCVYRFGSRALSYQADILAVPSIRWLGPYPSELSKLCERSSELTELDKSKLNDLLTRPYMQANKKIEFEVKFMITMNCKAEIEDMELSVGYLSTMYLPHKIATGEFV